MDSPKIYSSIFGNIAYITVQTFGGNYYTFLWFPILQYFLLQLQSKYFLF